MHRHREWDEVVTVSGPAAVGGEAHLVVLERDRVVLEDGSLPFDAASLISGLRTNPPYRAWVVHRHDGAWGVAARRIDVIELDVDPGGDDVELVWDGVERVVHVDGSRAAAAVDQLDAIGRRRFATFVVTAHRLEGALWEVDVAPL